MTTFITFLGTGQYQTVTYTWEGRNAPATHLFPFAATELFTPERVVVCVTPQGKESTHFATLRAKLGERLQDLDIPEGRSEKELWEIFDRVAGAVEEGETTILDITHAFRSIPMVVFAVAAYLRRAKNVKIERIVYGAFEAREPFRTPPQPEDRAPVFDLTPLLDLLDWTSGVEALLKRGDAGRIAEKMIATHQALRRSGGGTPKKLKKLGQKLQTVSQALYLNRPREVLRTAHELLPLLDEAKVELKEWAKPFAAIADQIRRDIKGLAFAEPDMLTRENLEKQLYLVEYYVHKGLLVQAVTLAREWVVSYVLLCRGRGDWLRLDDRKEVEDALGTAIARLRGENAEVPDWFAKLSQEEALTRLWNELGQLRNDLAHCAMSTDARSAQAIEQDANTIPRKLQALIGSAPDAVLHGARVVIDLSTFYEGTARLEELPQYLDRAGALAGEGNEVVLTGQAPIWLYLAVAHALHGKARRLLYYSPVTGEVCIFDHRVR